MKYEKCGADKLEQMKFAIKCSCFSQAINLSIMEGCKQKFVKNAMEIIKKMLQFFSTSAKKIFTVKNILNSTLKA